MGKKYHENNARADKKIIKIMGNLEKNAGNRGHNIIFFPLLF
jgi:hypothetical protein